MPTSGVFDSASLELVWEQLFIFYRRVSNAFVTSTHCFEMYAELLMRLEFLLCYLGGVLAVVDHAEQLANCAGNLSSFYRISLH